MANENSYSIFNDRKLYINSAFIGKAIEPIDVWKERTLYGKVDECGDAIQVSTDVMDQRIKKLQANSPVLALDFVANAFKSLEDSFTRAETFGHIKTDSIIKMKPKKGFVHFDSLYVGHMKLVEDIIIDSYLSDPIRSAKVKNFDDFLNMMKIFIEEFASSLPITKSSLIKSKYCTPLISGIIIELLDENYNDNDLKTKWLNDPNFDFYLNTSRKTGFLVDENVPWRLIANLRSPNLRDKFFPPDLVSVGVKEQKVFYNYFSKVYMNDVAELKFAMGTIYNNFVASYPVDKKVYIQKCKSGKFKLVEELIIREKVQESDIKKYDDNYCLKFYLHLKLHENNLNFSKQKMKTINKKIDERKKYVDFSSALCYINYVVKGSKKCRKRKGFGTILPPPIEFPPAPAIGEASDTKSPDSTLPSDTC